ncbi:MAG TPA: S8 family peptidase [Polyangiaceae bacterium]|jgi:hypothetical protein|nr:S8 family peptidase [Polyangiaceae bacterium]
MAIIGHEVPHAAPRTALARRVVVKFEAGVALPYAAHAQQAAARHLGRAWDDLVAAFPGAALKPYFTTHDESTLRNMQAAPRPYARVQQSTATRFTSYYALECPPGSDPDAIARKARQWPGVETAYVEGGPTPPPVQPNDDPRNVNQRYESAAPGGIDARWAWSQGYDGGGVGFVDVEQGWTLDHEDLAKANITLISGVNEAFAGHGTAVLGEVLAVDNTIGGVGIAPGASGRVISQYRTVTNYNTADAILTAAASMSPGDVMLIEAQTNSTFGYAPVEIELATFDAIAHATGQGIVVVEAGANGAVDLDTFTDVDGKQILNPASADYRDSGAILVGAGSASTPHGRLNFSNYGARIDCFAWGEAIDTCGDGWTGNSKNAYTPSFGGTSGATPIVAGAALLLQDFRQKSSLPRLAPWEMRSLLSDQSLNTKSGQPGVDRIGVMPDLRSVIEQQRLTRRLDSRRWAIVAYILFGVVNDGDGVVIIPGIGPVHIDPGGPLVPFEQADLLVAMAVSELAKLSQNGVSRMEMSLAAVQSMQRSVSQLGHGLATERVGIAG